MLSLFLDEILMPRDSPPIMQNALFVIMQRASCRKLRFAGFLVPSCPKHALVWETVVRGLRIKIFVRVLHSSRVNLNNVNNTNVFCCV